MQRAGAFRPVQRLQQGEVLHAGALEIRAGDGVALAGGRVLRLSVREFEMLVELGRNAGRVMSRDELYEELWGGAMPHGDRSVDVYVHKLRSKLDEALPGWAFIHTHFGAGYRLAPEWLVDEPAGPANAAAPPARSPGRRRH
jgi:DNA-binding response OmpR family regulator